VLRGTPKRLQDQTPGCGSSKGNRLEIARGGCFLESPAL